MGERETQWTRKVVLWLVRPKDVKRIKILKWYLKELKKKIYIGK